MKFKLKKQVTNGEVITGMILAWVNGFVLSYLHWGLNYPWW